MICKILPEPFLPGQKNTVRNYHYFLTRFKKAYGHCEILKITSDDIIFMTDNSRNRLLLELMARGGMRVGEALKLKTHNVHGKLNDNNIIKTTKSKVRSQILKTFENMLKK